MTENTTSTIFLSVKVQVGVWCHANGINRSNKKLILVTNKNPFFCDIKKIQNINCKTTNNMALDDTIIISTGKPTMTYSSVIVNSSNNFSYNNQSTTAKAYNSNSNNNNNHNSNQMNRNIATNDTNQKVNNSKSNNKTSSSNGKKSVGNGTKKQRRSNNNKANTNSAAAISIERERKYYEKFVAMDCEMVGAGIDGSISIAARVTIVDWYHTVLLDLYIKPDRPVTDYRTHVSGIVPTDIEYNSTAVSIYSCRRTVSALLKDKILVGHGLRNDLFALGIYHPWYMIRDTARYEPFMKVRYNIPPPVTTTQFEYTNEDNTNTLWPRKLKDLCYDYLHIEIQTIGYSHSSYEDAIAALELYKTVEQEWEYIVKYKLRKTLGIQKKQQKKLIKKQQQQQQLQQPEHQELEHQEQCLQDQHSYDNDSLSKICKNNSEDEHTASTVSFSSGQSSSSGFEDEDDDDTESVHSNYYDASSYHHDDADDIQQLQQENDFNQYMLAQMNINDNIDVPSHVVAIAM